MPCLMMPLTRWRSASPVPGVAARRPSCGLSRPTLRNKALADGQQVLVVPTDPWRYDPSVGAKETLIGEVLGALGSQIKETEGVAGKARALLKKLKNRVDWSKAIQVAAKASLALQLPSVDDLTSLIKTDGGESEESESRGLAEFHAEFRELMELQGTGAPVAGSCTRRRPRPLPVPDGGRYPGDHPAVPGGPEDGVRDRGRRAARG